MTNTNIQWAVNILEDNMEGMSKKEKINYLEDVAYKGCATGCVSGAIASYELDAIFTTHMHDILERLDEITEECGGDVLQAYMKKENKTYTDFAECAIWLIIEDTAGSLGAELAEEAGFFLDEDEEEEE
ncbi:hypothetical protein [Bacillus phage SBSphiJ6]|nr:hypothetical protein [Bacillus phage SBSphiJ2]UPI12267.1 hypothetical protein [Bacillus phage SBSphiJ3]UPI13012.1 hypothetical protein [Bacillus phage SBSphiJ6]